MERTEKHSTRGKGEFSSGHIGAQKRKKSERKRVEKKAKTVKENNSDNHVLSADCSCSLFASFYFHRTVRLMNEREIFFSFVSLKISIKRSKNIC